MDLTDEWTEEWPRPLTWLRGLLQEELTPYPGSAATLVMLITMIFHLPFGFQAIYALVISRESHWATVGAVKMAVIGIALAALYMLVGMVFSLGNPELRLCWVIATLFIVFFILSVIADYTTAVGFGILVGLSIPVLDRHISTELKVEQTLWAAGQTILAAVIAALVALFYAGLKPRSDPVRPPVAERLTSVADVLDCYASGRPVEENTAKQITRLVMLGTSTLRRDIKRCSYPPHYAEQMGVLVSLLGRLVDIAAGLASLDVRVSESDRQRFQTLARNIGTLRADILEGRTPRLIEFPVNTPASLTMPLVPQMEQIVSMMAEVFAGSISLGWYAPSLLDEVDPPPSLFVRDAFSNPEHLKTALRGCLAASLCYITYTALDWNGIGTAVVTCILTALTTIGSSRQKDVLRITGAIAGGAVSLVSQAFLLPALDSIGGFMLLFIVVTAASAWIATSGPRLSYFGIQLANAFYWIQLQDFGVQTSLVPARDRVIGIMLGLLMMWLVFDPLGSTSTAVQMKKVFISLFHLLAQLASEPFSPNLRAAIKQSFSLRETINSSFNQVRDLADTVWFEFGPARQQNLELRRRIVGWQPQLRMLFISYVSLLKYRLRIPGFELPESVRLAQQQFEECLARTLNDMADRLQGGTRERTQSLELAFAQLKESVRIAGSVETHEVLNANLKTFLLLSERITGLADSLAKDI
jgi:multidrug resistance protein MdtO